MIKAKAYAAQNPNETLAPWDFARRDVGNHDVQIEILYCGVCHSDLAQINNEWFPGVFPMVPGHEIVGRVTKVGDHVKKFKVGDLAGVGTLANSCGHCQHCEDGLEVYCENGVIPTYNAIDKYRDNLPTYGGYSNTIVSDESFAVSIPENLDLAATAPLLCAGITTYSPLKHWKVGKGHKLAVLGLGGLGHMAVKFAVALGAEVTILSTSPHKAADAEKLGAHHFVVTSDAEAVEKVKASFDFIVDTVSAEHDFDFYLSLLKLDGIHIVVGIPPEGILLKNVGMLQLGRKSIVGSASGGIAETQEMLDFCAEHQIVADIEMIEMKNIHSAFDRMAKGDVKYRFVIDMSTL
ncbi:putative zinc-type alcohol dehydrogenase-like protein [Chryseobacterium ginsenosidimutans]|uniref:NAD(P)-dependent alcohol dehydrogenase n=1 Tax=Chryseobacterium ginsenosidimutans TaxID=687846 RepID=UPI002168048B|nr:NAD(P)-dependent alcohol dehydrogenase [Chryseobacterium ginsenosidimutans]MCS3868356.1 putative zinc-type alcohol dehydrogenase-like protein [Chryseobacterium ginsenosidimutans]